MYSELQKLAPEVAQEEANLAEAKSNGLGLGALRRHPMTGCGAQSLGFRERAAGSHRSQTPTNGNGIRAPKLAKPVLRLRLLGAESEAEAAQSRAPTAGSTGSCQTPILLHPGALALIDGCQHVLAAQPSLTEACKQARQNA